MRALLLCSVLVLAACGEVDTGVNPWDHAEQKARACTERGGIPAIVMNYDGQLAFYGCTEPRR